MTDRVYQKPEPLADWLKDFANDELQKGSPFEQLTQVFKFSTVESMVQDLRKRVGLDLILGEASTTDDSKKEASVGTKLGSDTALSSLSDDILKEHIQSLKKSIWGLEEITFENKAFDEGEWADHLKKLQASFHAALAENKKRNLKLAGDRFENHLVIGIKAEMEHTDDLLLAEKTAKERLLEDENHYTHLFEIKQKYAEYIQQLVAFANALENLGETKKAERVDIEIKKTMLKKAVLDNLHPRFYYEADDKEIDIFKKHPAIKKFIDNVCKARQGHVNLPSILKMLNDERQEDVDTTDVDLREYIAGKIDDERRELPDNGDDVAGLESVTVFISVDEDDGNNEVFSKPARL